VIGAQLKREHAVSIFDVDANVRVRGVKVVERLLRVVRQAWCWKRLESKPMEALT